MTRCLLFVPVFAVALALVLEAQSRRPSAPVQRPAFTVVEAPTRVKVLVIDGDTSGYTCTTLPFNPTAGIIENKANLPVTGNAVFDDVAEGNKYLVVGIGEKANGVRVALDCIDQVNVNGGADTIVTLGLKNVVADMNGVK